MCSLCNIIRICVSYTFSFKIPFVKPNQLQSEKVVDIMNVLNILLHNIIFRLIKMSQQKSMSLKYRKKYVHIVHQYINNKNNIYKNIFKNNNKYYTFSINLHNNMKFSQKEMIKNILKS